MSWTRETCRSEGSRTCTRFRRSTPPRGPQVVSGNALVRASCSSSVLRVQFQIEGARGYGRGGSVGLSLDPRDLSFGGTAYLYGFRSSTPPRLCIRGSLGVTVEGVSRFVLYPRDLSFGGIAYLYRFRSSTPPRGPQVVSGNSHASCSSSVLRVQFSIREKVSVGAYYYCSSGSDGCRERHPDERWCRGGCPPPRSGGLPGFPGGLGRGGRFWTPCLRPLWGCSLWFPLVS